MKPSKLRGRTCDHLAIAAARKVLLPPSVFHRVRAVTCIACACVVVPVEDQHFVHGRTPPPWLGARLSTLITVCAVPLCSTRSTRLASRLHTPTPFHFACQD